MGVNVVPRTHETPADRRPLNNEKDLQGVLTEQSSNATPMQKKDRAQEKSPLSAFQNNNVFVTNDAILLLDHSTCG